MENYTPDYLQYLHWETEAPLQAILVAGEAAATCPPRARQWAACRLLVETLGGEVRTRYADTEDQDDPLPCQPLARLAEDLRHGLVEAEVIVVFAPEVWDDAVLAVTAWQREMDVYYVQCPGGYRHPAMSTKLLFARRCRRQRLLFRACVLRLEPYWDRQVYQYAQWWAGRLSIPCRPIDGPEGYGYHRALVDADGRCRGRAPQGTPDGQAVLMPVPEEMTEIRAMICAVWEERLGAEDLAQQANARRTEQATSWTAAHVQQVLLDETLLRIGFEHGPVFRDHDFAGLAERLQDAAVWPREGRQAICYLHGTRTPQWRDLAHQRAVCAHQATAMGLTLRRMYWDLSGLDAYAAQQGWQALLDDLAWGSIRPQLILCPETVWTHRVSADQEELQHWCDRLHIPLLTLDTVAARLPLTIERSDP